MIEVNLQCQSGGRPQNFQYVNRYKSAADCSIFQNLTQRVTVCDRITADTLQTFKFGRS